MNKHAKLKQDQLPLDHYELIIRLSFHPNIITYQCTVRISFRALGMHILNKQHRHSLSYVLKVESLIHSCPPIRILQNSMTSTFFVFNELTNTMKYGEGSYLTLFSPSDRMQYGPGGGAVIQPCFHQVTSLRVTELVLHRTVRGSDIRDIPKSLIVGSRQSCHEELERNNFYSTGTVTT